MVYRSLGKDVPQDEIWPAIAKQNRFGSLASTTHLMARDALSRGFSAVAIQARHPLQALLLCRDAGIRAILNHRPRCDTATGHYSVFVDIDDKNVVLHDPFFGPSRRLSHSELLELWNPRFPNSEILGNGLIGVAAGPTAAAACESCRTPMPSSVECPKCKGSVGLQPGALLRCMNNACIDRMWNYICCPACDYTWTFSLQPQAGASATSNASSRSPDPGAASGAVEDPLNFDRLFGEMDKFCSHVLSLPGAATHPDIKAQIQSIRASKEKLRLVQSEQLVHQKTHKERLMIMLVAAKQREEAHRKKMEELNTASPPLEGNALGRDLLKNLGLTG
jgi:hypothetical protein